MVGTGKKKRKKGDKSKVKKCSLSSNDVGWIDDIDHDDNEKVLRDNSYPRKLLIRWQGWGRRIEIKVSGRSKSKGKKSASMSGVNISKHQEALFFRTFLGANREVPVPSLLPSFSLVMVVLPSGLLPLLLVHIVSIESRKYDIVLQLLQPLVSQSIASSFCSSFSSFPITPNGSIRM